MFWLKPPKWHIFNDDISSSHQTSITDFPHNSSNRPQKYCRCLNVVHSDEKNVQSRNFFFFFFFLMKSNAKRGAPEWCSPYESRTLLALLKRRQSWSSERVEAWVFVNPGFEGLKIVSARKDGGREGVPAPWSHRDKRISEWSGPALFKFDRERVLGPAKRVLRTKHALGGIIDFNSSEHLPW